MKFSKVFENHAEHIPMLLLRSKSHGSLERLSVKHHIEDKEHDTVHTFHMPMGGEDHDIEASDVEEEPHHIELKRIGWKRSQPNDWATIRWNHPAGGEIKEYPSTDGDTYEVKMTIPK